MTQSKPGKGANCFPIEFKIVEPWVGRNCGRDLPIPSGMVKINIGHTGA